MDSEYATYGSKSMNRSETTDTGSLTFTQYPGGYNLTAEGEEMFRRYNDRMKGSELEKRLEEAARFLMGYK